MPALKISKRATNISALIKVSKHVVLSVNPTQPEQDQDKEPFFVVFHRSEFDEKNPHLTPPALIPLLSQHGLEQDQFSWDTSVDDLFPLMISTLPKQSDPTTLIETEQRISLLELDGPLNLSSDQVTRLDLSLSFSRRGGMLSEVHNAQNLRAISLLLPSYFKDFFPIMPQWHKNLIAQHPVVIYLLRNAQYPSCFLPSYVCDHPFVKLYQSKRENTKIFHLKNNIIAYVPKDRTNLTGFTNAANLSEMSVDEETFCIERHLVSILEKPTQRPVQGRDLLMPCAIFQKVCPPSDAPNYIVHSFQDDLRPLLLSYLDTAHKIKFMSAYPQYTALVQHALRKDFFNLELDVRHIALTPLHATCNLKPKGLHNHNGTLSIHFKSNALKDRKQNDRCFTYITEEGSKEPLFVVGPFWAKSFNNPFGKYDLFENLFYMTRQMLFHKMFEQNGLTQVQTFPLIVEEQFIGQPKRKESCFLPLEFSRPALCQNALFSLYTQDHHFALRLLPQENLYEHSKKGSSYNLQFLDQRTHTNSDGTVTSMASAPIHLKSSFLKCNSMDTLTASLEKVFSDLLNVLFPNTYNGSFRTKWSIDMDGVKRISPPITLHVDCLELETLSLPEGLSVHDISRLIIQDVTKDFDPETLSSIHPKPGPNKPTLVLGNGASIHPCFFEKFNIHGVGKVILQRPGRNMG